MHTGFYTAWTEASEAVVTEVNRLRAQFPSFQVVCTGHSMGGALAMLCAADMRTRGIPATAYTYGQPRVGNAAFASWYATLIPDCLRVTAYGDIFTQLPPQAYFEYRHQPTEVFFNNSTGSIRVCDNSGEDPTCSNSVPNNELNGDNHWYYLGIFFGACYLQ